MFLLFTLLGLTCVALVGWGFTGPNRSLRFASLMGATMAGFAVPQIIGENNAGVVSPDALQMFIIMSILCMACAFMGDLWGARHPGRALRGWADYDERRVMDAAVLLNCVAVVTSLLIILVFREEIARRSKTPGGMSGPMTIVVFFSTVQRYGFALALLLFWRRKSILATLMVLFGLFTYANLVISNARRGPAIEFVFICLLTYAMGRRKRIPALFITVLFVGGTLWSSAIADFRTQDDRDFFEKLGAASYVKDYMNVLENGGLEVRNGCDIIKNAYDFDAYEFGKIHWNRLVNAYFPAQIFGRETKDGLKFDIEDVAEQANMRRGTVGVAETGMADCFSSFGYFGCLKFMLIGFVMGRWYRRAFEGDLSAQLTYSTLISVALHSVSHGTSLLLNDYIHLAVFSYPVLYLARKPARLVNPSQNRARLRPSGTEPPIGVAQGLR